MFTIRPEGKMMLFQEMKSGFNNPDEQSNYHEGIRIAPINDH